MQHCWHPSKGSATPARCLKPHIHRPIHRASWRRAHGDNLMHHAKMRYISSCHAQDCWPLLPAQGRSRRPCCSAHAFWEGWARNCLPAAVHLTSSLGLRRSLRPCSRLWCHWSSDHYHCCSAESLLYCCCAGAELCAARCCARQGQGAALLTSGALSARACTGGVSWSCCKLRSTQTQFRSPAGKLWSVSAGKSGDGRSIHL